MYFPYFRGKQYDLIAIRDTAETLATHGFIPIIEPVRDNLSGLERALRTLCEAGGSAIVVVNPKHGELSEDGQPISELLSNLIEEIDGVSAGVYLHDEMSVAQALSIFNDHEDHSPCFVHAGFHQAANLSEELGASLSETRHIFFERHCGQIYREHFAGATRILLRDGFEKRKNADHPPLEEFSELHLTYETLGLDGFGDFLIVGDEYSEGGGPAYAVAIHITFVNSQDNDIMYIHHFLSNDRSTPDDPAGKFAQALQHLITHLNSDNSQILETSAIEAFRQLHEEEHFPGLGQAKKLSMIHHIETLADFFRS